MDPIPISAPLKYRAQVRIERSDGVSVEFMKDGLNAPSLEKALGKLTAFAVPNITRVAFDTPSDYEADDRVPA